ncbi:oxidoreductase, aldo/keto reductase family protein [Treponema socranskii subsp. socranskii VPI DR56BR1116 = ATCC 35536]|uniref:Oxidoreductase, aldo/keto reductase family protein n=1 Tax=Treponema socranskii subsp. socranskii VPI DR56BR1116 = ATCC 35536 TaxID=1125725 RepID=U1FI83_TRESO|nr:aldo/keto reductase [Treponema socranskii]ERF59463.1 oxidoreductase, aldo/keto reductase family protein [Treponema socranskii subsp. socranskii VPI DR56BR1116 = ATCC 35536]ERK04872.1 oxidoreductase, aldo/keto reductase family protein [Treponema socranskii subsp. socranskii VPI DR56BR1116 = ATCC 35536]
MNHKVKLSNGAVVPAIGQGTWYIGETPSKRAQEIDAIRAGIEAGMTLVDTAEMYGSGLSEKLVGEAISSTDRKKLFIVSKVLPSNAGKKNMEHSCDATLERLGTDYLDLYLYHWRGSVPLAETVACLEELKAKGKIRAWGVSNFDTSDMEELFALPSGKNCAVNQVLYHLGSRGIEFDLLPWMRRHGVALMAYCPLAQAGTLRRGLFENETVAAVAEKHDCDVTQVLLSWCIRDGSTIAIPRSSKKEHTLLNAGADALMLDEEDFINLDKAFPPPSHKMPLDVE